MNEKQRALLKELADFLDDYDSVDHEGKEFDMCDWSCESSACAVGHAYHFLPSWREAGLEMVSRTDLRTRPKFNGETDFEAVATFLGISLLESQALFDPDFYNGADGTIPWEVACRIYAFLEGEPA